MQERSSEPAQWQWHPPGAGVVDRGRTAPAEERDHDAADSEAWNRDAWERDGGDGDTGADLASLFDGPSEGATERSRPARRAGRALLLGMAALAIVVVAVAAALLARPTLALPSPPEGEVAAADPTAGTEQRATPHAGPPPDPSSKTDAEAHGDATGPVREADRHAAGAPVPTPAMGPTEPMGPREPMGPMGPVLQAVRVAATGTPRHVLDAAVVATTAVGALSVVTVDAVVVDGDAGSWAAPRRARFGVAQRAADGAVLGTPWALPLPDPAAEPAWEPLEDPPKASAVRDALAAAGFRDLPPDHQAIGLARSSELPGVLRAELRARAPGAPAAEQQQMWLDDGDRPALLGAR